MRGVALLLTAAIALAACGKLGPPQPPGPPEKIVWPHGYPKASSIGY
jgi:predicted small lipoprotein YifL